jgi:hypothetical protein
MNIASAAPMKMPRLTCTIVVGLAALMWTSSAWAAKTATKATPSVGTALRKEHGRRSWVLPGLATSNYRFGVVEVTPGGAQRLYAVAKNPNARNAIVPMEGLFWFPRYLEAAGGNYRRALRAYLTNHRRLE